MGRTPWSRLQTARLGVKLILFSALVSTATVSVSFLALSLEVRSHTRDLLSQTLARHQQTLADLQRRTLQELVRASTLMSDSPTLLAAMDTFRVESALQGEARVDLLNTIQREVDKIAVALNPDLLLVTGGDGRVLATAGRVMPRPRLGEDLSTNGVVRHALSQTDPVDHRNFSVMSLQRSHYQVGCVPILLQGYIVGTLILGDRADQAYVEALRDSLGGEVVLVSGDAIIGSTLPAEMTDGFRRSDDGHEAPDPAVVILGGEEFVSAAVSLGEDDQGQPLTVHMMSSLTRALSASSRSLRMTLIGYGLLVVMVTGLSASLVSRSVLRPLESLVQFMRAAASSGDRTRRFEAPGAATEVRILADTFNRLMATLQQHEERILEKAREDLEHLDRLKESEKLAALGRMLSGAAHEINNPMTGVIGNIDLLLQKQDLEGPVRHRLEEIRKQGHRVVALTRNLLRIARRDEGKHVPVDIHQVLRETVALRQRDYERAGMRIAFNPAPIRARLIGNELELSQVFLNIVNNAYDALKEAGGARTLEIATSAFRGEVTVTFSDDGPGLKDPSKVFEHFYTTKPLGQGTGLGLSISQAIIRSHGGVISAENRPGGGARFTIVLPERETRDREAAREPASTDVPESRKPLPATILVVDDEPVVLDLQMAILDALGARASAATSGAEAIDLLRRRDFDLIISDLLVDGEVTGTDLFDWCVEHRAAGSLGVVLVTGEAEGGPGSPDARNVRCLQKPFEMQEYVRMLHEAWDELP